MSEQFIENIDKVIIGKRDVAEKILIALLSEGHVLIEDVPGVGKTTLAKSVAQSINCSFSRIQFTPDLLPSDILGVSVYNQQTTDFLYKKGPIYKNIVLADEINRASPKTQSALLEAMEERQVTMDGNTYKIQEPYLVIATQNPVEYEGTFALPEAQLDRFLMKIKIGYPDPEHELKILEKIDKQLRAEDLEPILSADNILEMRDKVSQVKVKKSLEEYIFKIIRETREHEDVLLGCSPRAAIALYKAVKAKAFIEGRDFVVPEDIKKLSVDILSHRLILKPEERYKGKTSEGKILDILKMVQPPKLKEV